MWWKKELTETRIVWPFEYLLSNSMIHELIKTLNLIFYLEIYQKKLLLFEQLIKFKPLTIIKIT